MNDPDTLPSEKIEDAVAVLRKAQEGDPDANRDLAEYFPEYEGLVMQTDHARYLQLAANVRLEATHLLIIRCGGWLASVDTYTSDLSMPLASVAVGGEYASRTEALREAVRAATDNGWTLGPEHEWSDYDCGGGEVHIPIHAALPPHREDTMTDTGIPTGPIDREPLDYPVPGVFPSTDRKAEILVDVFHAAGVEMGAYDTRIATWLAESTDWSTFAVIASWVQRAAAGDQMTRDDCTCSEAVETVLADYLDQVDPEEVDTQDLAENVLIALDRHGRGEH